MCWALYGSGDGVGQLEQLAFHGEGGVEGVEVERGGVLAEYEGGPADRGGGRHLVELGVAGGELVEEAAALAGRPLGGWRGVDGGEQAAPLLADGG
ncbi:hypothetical protein [Streptomyces albus]|uniref:hypothetical protein n=1 Tax=Streptomyces albus TaxID=1888 RepID=UPI0006E428B7|nr:hypothetical protein [Streptomyces albus]